MRRAVLSLLLLAAGAAGACGQEDSSPQGAVKAFLAAVASAEPDKVHALLDAPTRRALQTLAAQASRHTGGRKQLKPEDMILLELAISPHEVSAVEVVTRTDSEARVRLSSGGKTPATEELTLVNEDGAWRIRLKLPRPE